MKKRSLIDRVKDSFVGQELARAGKILRYSPKHRYSTLGTALFLGTSLACGNPIEPEIDEMPKMTIGYISPTSGMAPLQVGAGVACTDDKGIREYRLTKESETLTRTNPTDTTFTFTEPGNYTAKVECEDTKGQVASYGPVGISVTPQPTRSFSQTLTLEDGVNLRLNATFENLDSVIMDVSKNGNPVLSKTIKPTANQNYTELFSYSTNPTITKGNYDFTARWKTHAGKDTSVTVRDSIPTYPFKMNLDNVNLDEETDTTETLPAPVYTNPEDNPAVWDSVIPLDGKTTASLNSSQLTIAGNPNQTGDYGLNLRVRSNTGRRDSTTKRGLLHDRLDVEVFLEDNEQHQRWPGIAGVYRAADSTKIGEIQIGSDGRGYKKLEQKVADLTGDILIQARRIENISSQDTATSYVRTVKVPAKDQRGLILRVVPYDGLTENGITPKDFRRHVAEVLTKDDNNGQDPLNFNPLISKWNSRGPDKIIIPKMNNDPNNAGYFTQQTAEGLRARFLDPKDLGIAFRGRINDTSQVKIVESFNWADTEEDYGKLVIFPWDMIGGATIVQDINSDGYVDRGQIRIGVDINGQIKNQIVIAHEYAIHGIGLSGHAETLLPEKTIANASGNISTVPLFADIKTDKLINEDSYTHGTGSKVWFTNYNLGLNDILSLTLIK